MDLPLLQMGPDDPRNIFIHVCVWFCVPANIRAMAFTIASTSLGLLAETPSFVIVFPICPLLWFAGSNYQSFLLDPVNHAAWA